MDLLIGFVVILAIAGLVYLIIDRVIPLPPNIKTIAYYVLALFVLLALLDNFHIWSFRR